jgi:putative ABC transport system permease protein
MTLLSQQLLACRVGFLSLRQRLGPSFVIVVGMGCVVGVSLAMLSLTSGLTRTIESGGRSDHAIVYPSDVTDDNGMGMTRASIGVILNAPGIAVAPDGTVLGSAEVVSNVHPAQGFSEGSLLLRAIGPNGAAVRPGFAIVSGRMFHRGIQELIVGRGAASEFGLKVGMNVILPNGEWPIVGEFAADGSAVESQLLGDADSVMSAMRISSFGGVLVSLKNSAAFDDFKRWLVTNPSLSVTAERQTDYLQRTASFLTRYFSTLAYIVACMMAIGAVFGSVQIMYSTVEARTVEIATLRAIGYDPLPIAVSILLETILLSLIGALAGSLVAWLLFNDQQEINGDTIFRLHISGQMVVFGLFAAMCLAAMSGILPALRAARIPVVEALRST